ncbi:PtsGHI operon antiterminator [Paenibacillus macerans]|uniref:PRD domain-containing protein n=1 Tax=Paenibacillus macerans TaxID=44252 RepID=A0A090ZKN8_PAEMA|nr:PRD domain-containing protein [Paenibacillus macerans]KFN11172.1 ptsGHI operon antiterminator [Paenibacillus macerans]MBS5911309.1 PRD domain-containing protein [Paenibacillus macerans]MCY7561521.1 PRD domain-containing protein [Paenibacillus macerans]MDU5945985.1 PRD domain-containing protein [Paenibacillus macerans]MDU7474649.1 PRD domain-containing protein [Paenibacillus macerans]
MNSLRVAKVLNNNVIIANHPDHGEVVVIGKGIGFNRKSGESIPLEAVEKLFILTNQQEQEQYKQLIPQVDEQLIELIGEIIMYISSKTQATLNEHIHIALTDHLAFAIKRAEQDLAFHNPFLFETKELYPLEFELAEYAIDLIRRKMGVDLGQDETGFVALHINSAMTNRHISEVRGHAQLIADLVGIIEDDLQFSILRNSLDYSRLLTHLRFAIERVRRGERVAEVDKLESLLKREYPTLYALAWKLTKVMEKRLKMPVYQAEVSYLTMHLHRIVPPEIN